MCVRASRVSTDCTLNAGLGAWHVCFRVWENVLTAPNCWRAVLENVRVVLEVINTLGATACVCDCFPTYELTPQKNAINIGTIIIQVRKFIYPSNKSPRNRVFLLVSHYWSIYILHAGDVPLDGAASGGGGREFNKLSARNSYGARPSVRAKSSSSHYDQGCQFRGNYYRILQSHESGIWSGLDSVLCKKGNSTNSG